MRRTPQRALCLLALVLVAANGVLAEGVKEDYTSPRLVVPYCRVKPTIDGVVDEQEWQGAASVDALQTTRQTISARSSRFWLMWDEDNLYLAMRSPLRAKERVVQRLRHRERDETVIFDDCYELWFDVGARTAGGLECMVQYLGNFAGARYDALHIPMIGARQLDYSTGWAPRNRITPDGRAWEMEVRVPRASIRQDAPFAQGSRLLCLLARNYKRPWEQSSFEGSGAFDARELYTRLTLSKTAPAVHLLGVRDLKERTFGLDLAVFAPAHGPAGDLFDPNAGPAALGLAPGGAAQADAAVSWSFESDSGLRREGKIDLEPGKLVRITPGLDLDQPGKGRFRLRVLSGDARETYLDWCSQRQFGSFKAYDNAMKDSGEDIAVKLVFNPVKGYLRVTGDFIDFERRDKIERCQVTVTDSQGNVLAKRAVALDKLAYVSDTVPLGELGAGKYNADLACFVADGKELVRRQSSFTKKNHRQEFAWWDTPHGKIDRVLSPWTPVEYAAGNVKVWGRRVSVGAAGLPATIRSQERELLAGPTRLEIKEAGGAWVGAGPAALKTISRADHLVEIEARSRLAGLEAQSRVTTEFDGMYRVELTLRPKQPLAVDGLRMVVPLRQAAATFIHASGRGIRTGFDYGFLPKDKQGRIWDCLRVDGQPMAKGSFIPYVWIGDSRGGLCWFADSDRGWEPSDETPAIEVRREQPDVVDLVFNLISSAVTVGAPRTIVFAFQATPVKPLFRGWRMDPWWCGDTFEDWSGTKPKLGVERINAPLHFPVDLEYSRERVETWHSKFNNYTFGIAKYRALAVPYGRHNQLFPRYMPEARYFAEHWQAAGSWHIRYDKTLTDYMVHHLAEWAKEAGIDGYYSDNVRPEPCFNAAAGRAYRLPNGQLQPSYNMFGVRRFFLRMRAAFAEQGKHNKIVIHTTHNLIIPWLGVGDIAYDGESNVIYPDSGQDFMDKWSLERLRLDYHGQWGVAVNFMQEYQGKWERPKLLKAMRAYTGAVILHDALPSGNANAMNQPVWIGRDRFGIEAGDVEFIPYWEQDRGIACAVKNVHVAAWKRPGKVLLAVVNWGEKTTADVVLDAKALGLPEADAWEVVDAEAGTSIRRGKEVHWDAAAQGPVTRAANRLSVPVERHDYRQLLVK